MDPIKASSTTTRSRLLELPFEILIMILQFYCASLLSEQYLELIDNRFKVNLVAYSREVRSKKWTPSAPWYAHTFRGPRLYGTGVLYTSKTLWKAAQIAAVQMCHGSLSFETAGNNWQWPNRKNEFYQELGPILPFYLIREVSFNTGELESDLYPRFKWKKLTEFFNSDKWPILQKVVMRMDTPNPCGFEVWDVGALLRGEHDEELMECWTPYLPKMNIDDPEEICMHKDDLIPGETKVDRNITVELLVKERVYYWIWGWGSYVEDEEDDSCFIFVLRGKNFKELKWVERTFYSPPVTGSTPSDQSGESDASGEFSESSETHDPIQEKPAMKADGNDWEEKAVQRWPVLEGTLTRETEDEDE